MWLTALAQKVYKPKRQQQYFSWPFVCDHELHTQKPHTYCLHIRLFIFSSSTTLLSAKCIPLPFFPHIFSAYVSSYVWNKKPKEKWNEIKERKKKRTCNKKNVRHMFLFIHSLWLPGKSPFNINFTFLFFTSPFLFSCVYT